MVSADECIIVWGYRCSTLGSCQSGGVKRNILADHICRICDCFPGIPRRCTFCNECGNNDGWIRDKINRQRSGNIRNGISAFFDTNDEDCESAKHVAIWYQRGQNTFCHNIKWYECQKWILILTSYKYKFTIFTDCIERKYGKDWLL